MVVAGGVAYRYVQTTHKMTFYEHLTFKRYVETFWWNEARHAVDHKGRELETQEGIRACLPLSFSINYLPKVRYVEYYRENWARWEQEQPEWFDEEFKESVPRELLPT